MKKTVSLLFYCAIGLAIGLIGSVNERGFAQYLLTDPVTPGSFMRGYTEETGLLGPGIQDARRNWVDARSNLFMSGFVPSSAYPVEPENRLRNQEMRELRRSIAEANRHYYQQQQISQELPANRENPYPVKPTPAPQNLWSQERSQFTQLLNERERQPAQPAGQPGPEKRQLSTNSAPQWFRSSGRNGTNPGFGQSWSRPDNPLPRGNGENQPSTVSRTRSVGSSMFERETMPMDSRVFSPVPQTPEQRVIAQETALQKFQEGLEEMIMRSPDIHLLAPVEVKFESDTATLRGVVATEQQRVKAGQILLTVSEVKRVKNLMTVAE